MRLVPAKMLIPAHAAATVLAIAGVALWPPSSGVMLLIPLLHGDAAAVARAAVDGGAALLATGPFPGSLVVVGDRSRIARQIGRWDVVMTAFPAAGCGAAGISEGAA